METHRKLDQIRDLLLFSLAPFVFCISENKLSAKIDDAELAIDGYCIFRADRNRRGGGVLMYCHHSLLPRRVDISVTPIEALFIKIAPVFDHHLLIGCVYRPPSAVASWKGAFYLLVNVLSSDSVPSMIIGDFNIDLLMNAQFAKNLRATFSFLQRMSGPT